MTSSIIILIISTLLLGTLIYIRYFELSSEKVVIPENIRRIADRPIEKTTLAITKNIARMKNRVVDLLMSLPQTFVEVSHNFWKKVRDKVDRYYDRKHRGRDLNNRGSVSIYWERVSEGKRKEK